MATFTYEVVLTLDDEMVDHARGLARHDGKDDEQFLAEGAEAFRRDQEDLLRELPTGATGTIRTVGVRDNSNKED